LRNHSRPRLLLTTTPFALFFRAQGQRNQQEKRNKKSKKIEARSPRQRDGDGEPGEEARGGRAAPAAAAGVGVGTGAEGVRGVRGGERRGGDRRRARRVRGRDQGGADGAQDHLRREEGNPRRHMPQRRLHPVQGTAASARMSLLCARSVDLDGSVYAFSV
jgi:hypothetical protein